jgi:hypothetical protein
MKKQNFLFIGLIALAVSCSDKKDRYIDLRTGQTIVLEKNSNGLMVDKKTKKPVYIYVDTEKHDTIYGKTGAVINGHVVRGNDNIYWYDVDAKGNTTDDGEYKRKVDGDGDIKIKTDDKVIKIDGETGEKKVKNN